MPVRNSFQRRGPFIAAFPIEKWKMMIKKFIHIRIWSFEYSRIANPYSKPRDPDPYPGSNIFSKSGCILYENVCGSDAPLFRYWTARLLDQQHKICRFKYANTSNQNPGTTNQRFHAFTNERIKAYTVRSSCNVGTAITWLSNNG